MKAMRLILLISLSYLFSSSNVFAANKFTVSAPSTANANTNFEVEVKYEGESAGFIRLGVDMRNASCSVKSVHSSGVSNCSSGSCDVAYNSVTGITSGTSLLKLNCKSSYNTVTINAFLENNDAWSVDVSKQLAISSATKKITIKQVSTTKTTTTTTTKTTTRRTTTKAKTTTKNNKTTTTAGKENKTTTQKTTTINVALEPSTTTIENKETTTTTISPTTTSSTTTKLTTNIIPDNLKLSTLKIVGYPINFDPNRNSYEINISENVDEIYIIAEPIENSTKVKNIGVINIKDKNQILVTVYNEENDNEIFYKINITREMDTISIIDFFINNSRLIILFGSIAIFIAIAILTFIRMRYNKSIALERIDNINIEYDHTYQNDDKKIDDFVEIPETEEELTKVFSNINKEK